MRITVFTSTYNRGYILPQLYHSLQGQTFHDFEWIIVNDGSTDHSDEIIQGFVSGSHSFPISYFYVPNGGKHRAINLGVKHAKGELFFIVDSDDYLTPTSLETVDIMEKSIPESQKCKFAGICGLRGYNQKELIGSTFHGDVLDLTNLERDQHNISGDKSEVLYTDILKKYPFPEFEDEKFVVECIVWDQIAHDGYKLRFFNQIICICNYLEDGLSAHFQEAMIQSPRAYGRYVQQCSLFHKFSWLDRWELYYTYYEQEKNFLSMRKMSAYLDITLTRLILLIVNFKIQRKLFLNYLDRRKQ